MAAPIGTSWGSIVGSYGRIGIYTSVTNQPDNKTCKVNIQVWFWSKYSVSDSANSYYFNNNSSSASTLIGSIPISHTVASGDEWSTSNQTKLGESTITYTRSTSNKTIYCAAKFSNIDRVGGAMIATKSYIIPKLASYTISYNANGGTGAPSSQTKWYGTNVTLSSTKPTRTGYTFKGWATSASGSVTYNTGATYSSNADITLYAVWEIITYTISYNANGGTGAPSSQTKQYGKTLTLSSTKPTRTNYNFKGWATSASGSVAYKAGESYTANAKATLYAVWELAYEPPTITNLKVIRCDSEGTSIETGTYAKITFNWSCCQLTGENNISSITIAWSNTSLVPTATGTSGSVSQVFGDGSFSVDSSYVVTVTVKDSKNGSTVKTITLPINKFLVDFKAGGTGVSIGKAAELDDVFDVNFKIYPRNGFINPIIPNGTDLNTVMAPNVYSGYNITSAEYANCPITTGTFTLNVFSAGPSGQIGQVLKLCDKSKYAEYIRYYYGSAWGDWICIDNRKSKSLWSGAYYMLSNQTINLSELVSEQVNGIVLVWKRYADGAVQPDDIVTHFIHKLVVAANGGIGHNLQLGTSGFTKLGCKYLYISDDKIVGNDNNNKTGTVNGVTYANDYWVLAEVYGV